MGVTHILEQSDVVLSNRPWGAQVDVRTKPMWHHKSVIAIPNPSAAIDRSGRADRSRLLAAAGYGGRDFGSATPNCPLQRAGN
jgi:hypothetical protein